MRISDWSSDVCSSDLVPASNPPRAPALAARWSPKQLRGGGQFCARSREQTMSDYSPGFGNHISTEAVAGALPVGQNSPQRPAFGPYTEQLSGTALDRKSVVKGKRVSVRVDLVGRRIIKT